MIAKKTMFVITEANFTYNDETYSVEGNGAPLVAFSTEEEAKAYVKSETSKWIKENQGLVCSLGYSVEDIFNEKPDCIADDVWENLCAEGSWGLEEIVGDMTKKQLDDLVKVLVVKPFTIHKVTFGK